MAPLRPRNTPDESALTDRLLALELPDSQCRVGVFHYERFDGELRDLVLACRKSSNPEEDLAALKGFLATIPDKTAREDALGQYDRVESAVGSGRWHRSAVGQIIEATCLEENERLPNRLTAIRSAVEFLYPWNVDHAETILRFFSYISDQTISWGSSQDVWRVVIPPETVAEAAEAFNELTPREFRVLLESAEDGMVFSPEEAVLLADWWERFRKIVRLAWRQERGLFLAIRED